MANGFEVIRYRYKKSLSGFAWVAITFIVAATSSIVLIALAKALGNANLGILPSLMREFSSDGFNLKPVLMAGFIVSVLVSVIVDTFFVPTNSLDQSTKYLLFIAMISILFAGIIVLDLLAFEISQSTTGAVTTEYMHWSRMLGYCGLMLFVSIFKSYSFSRNPVS